VVLAFFAAAIGLCSDRLFFGFGQFAPMISGQPDKGLIPSVVEYQYYQVIMSTRKMSRKLGKFLNF
jgi:hypothetical protein